MRQPQSPKRYRRNTLKVLLAVLFTLTYTLIMLLIGDARTHIQHRQKHPRRQQQPQQPLDDVPKTWSVLHPERTPCHTHTDMHSCVHERHESPCRCLWCQMVGSNTQNTSDVSAPSSCFGNELMCRGGARDSYDRERAVQEQIQLHCAGGTVLDGTGEGDMDNALLFSRHHQRTPEHRGGGGGGGGDDETAWENRISSLWRYELMTALFAAGALLTVAIGACYEYDVHLHQH